MNSSQTPIRLTEGRFARFEAIAWWDQARLQAAKVLVVGAGALGNEVIKNLALLGVGRMLIVDHDVIEESNLSRSVLFRPCDTLKAKADVAARAAEAICPGIVAKGLRGNVLADVGLGWFRWADVVVGALDNREARVFVNRCCAQMGRPWLDGGIDVLNGIVRGFAPPETACYECTMGRTDWDLLTKRRSCSLLARKAFLEGGSPTTPTTASVIGAIQAQEVVKHLHGLQGLRGGGFVFEGLLHNSYTVSYPISKDCPWHEAPPPVETLPFSSSTPLTEITRWAKERWGGLDAIDLSRELVESLTCPGCGRAHQVLRPIDSLTDADALCPDCGAERVPQFVHSIPPGSPLEALTASQLGLPTWDVLWPRYGDRAAGVELSQDRPAWAADACDKEH